MAERATTTLGNKKGPQKGGQQILVMRKGAGVEQRFEFGAQKTWAKKSQDFGLVPYGKVVTHCHN